jgi:hypothetical protein
MIRGTHIEALIDSAFDGLGRMLGIGESATPKKSGKNTKKKSSTGKKCKTSGFVPNKKKEQK